MCSFPNLLLLHACVLGALSCLISGGGDFHAMLGHPCERDDTDILGTCRFGQRNERGWILAHCMARTRLLVQSRLGPQVRVEDSSTCRRAMHGQVVQAHYIFSTGALALVMFKYDHSMQVGLDHRCVHCILHSCVEGRETQKKNTRRISFQNLRPQLDCDDAPTLNIKTKTISDNNWKPHVALGNKF